MAEAELYEPIKRFLETQGYAVKGEVGACDIVAVREDEGPVVVELKERLTIVLVTHDLAQGRRVADWLGCLCLQDGAGELLETACCAELLENPRCRAVADFVRQST